MGAMVVIGHLWACRAEELLGRVGGAGGGCLFLGGVPVRGFVGGGVVVKRL